MKPGDGSGTVSVMGPAEAHGGRRRVRRRPRRATRRNRRTAVLAVLGLAVLLVLVLAAFASSPPGDVPPVPVTPSAAADRRPLPLVVAVQGSLDLQLPITQRAVTALGYHSAGEAPLPLEPIGRRANEGFFSRLWHTLFGGGAGGVRYYQLGGGDGPATGALDVGAAPGTDVFSPVDGNVVSIRDHVLSGRRFGDRVDIQPSGAPTVVVSLTQLRATGTLTVGAPVTSGRTKIGVVLDLSSVEEQTLARHTHDTGSHVEVEVHAAAALPLR